MELLKIIHLRCLVKKAPIAQLIPLLVRSLLNAASHFSACCKACTLLQSKTRDVDMFMPRIMPIKLNMYLCLTFCCSQARQKDAVNI